MASESLKIDPFAAALSAFAMPLEYKQGLLLAFLQSQWNICQRIYALF